MSNYSANQLADDPNHVWSKLLKLIPDGATVLDVGCSSGNLGVELQRSKSCVVDGIEPDATDAATAASKLRRVWNFDVEDGQNLAQVKTKYDVIVFADVLEHLVDPAATLKAMRGLLKPGGSVVFSLPNMAHVSVRLSLLGGTFEYTEVGLLDKTHLHFYDLAGTRQLFEQAGMRLGEFDSSSFEYSDDLLKKRLEDLGFTPSPKGLKLLRTPDAAAFQYVGKAMFGREKSTPLKPTTQAVAKDIQLLSSEVKANQRVNERLNKEVFALRQHVRDLSEQLDALANSQTYRLGNAIAKPIRLIKASTKKGHHDKK